MAGGTNEDDFWNESSSSGFNFCDDDDDSTFSETDAFNSFIQENTTLPIHSIISNKCLKIILDDLDCTIEHIVPPVDDTIKKMFFGENFILDVYKTLEDKSLLLDTALEIGDGNIITAVVLFLKKSLKNNIFMSQLSKRKVAIRHYANYLIERNDLQDLIDFYMATGNIFNLKDIYYLMSRDVMNQSVLYKRLNQFNSHHSQNLYSTDDKIEIQENISFIEFQMKHKYDCASIVEQLIILCKTEWTKDSGDEVISNFKKKFKLDDFQYEWVIMSVLCKLKNWDKLLATFLKTVWMIKKRALKSTIRPELFVIGIGRYEPPKNIIDQFLSCVGDVGKTLYLAEKLKAHSFIINYYVEQKDRMSLLKYMEKVDPGSEALQSIQLALNNSDIKWKN